MPDTGRGPEVLLRRMFDCAVAAVSAERVLPAHLPREPKGRTVLLAVGKAAAAMADVVAARWQGALSGLAVTRYGHALNRRLLCPDLELIEASHPVPDSMSVTGACRALELVSGLGKDDLVIVLISGGGSSLWCLPIPGVTLEHKQRITSQLLVAGATVNELNTVRKWLSQIKGGRLAAAASPARVETLIISDVVSNDPSVIASGPTIPSGGTLDDVENILRRYRVDVPDSVREAMRNHTPPPAADDRQDNRCHVVAVPTDALAAAELEAVSMGFEVRMLGGEIEGEAREAAVAHAEIAREVAQTGKPTVILSGGEVTVTVRERSGIGGPNTEFLLSLAIALDGIEGVHALACDTDGYDGIGDNAGAIIGPDTLERAREKQVDPSRALDNNDSYRFFEALGDLIVTGPTQTNVSDFRAILVGSGR